MSWYSMVSLVHAMVNGFGVPRALLLHVGANDIGAWSTKELIYHMKFALFIIKRMLPGCALIYSCMLPRYGVIQPIIMRWEESINCKHRCPNIFTQYWGLCIEHLDLDGGHTALFAANGIHLSFLGNDIFINANQGAMEQFLLYPNSRVFPNLSES